MNKLMQKIARTIRRVPVMVTMLVVAGFFALPATGLAQGQSSVYGNENPLEVGTGQEALDRSNMLFRNLRGLVGWILLVALVFAGLLAAFGQYKSAWGVAIAAIIIYGGTWVVGLIRQSLKD